MHTYYQVNIAHVNKTISVELLIELTLVELIFECVETNLFAGLVWFVFFFYVISYQIILFLTKCSHFSPFLRHLMPKSG